VSGAAVGALAYRLYTVNTAAVAGGGLTKRPQGPPRPEDVRRNVIAHLKDAIKLDDQQVAQIQKLYEGMGAEFDRVKPQYDAQMNEIHRKWAHQRDVIHDEYVAKIKAILRPDQQALYNKWLDDRAAERKRRQQQQRKDFDKK
jgi:Spy/CpxP family protein refolding chaperone